MSEIDDLIGKYGKPTEHQVEITTDRLFGPVNKMDRRGEVIFVLRRPGGRVLLTTKSFYPDGVYRLPSGGIGPQEGIEAALIREVEEETGLSVPVTRFLAIIHYRIHVGQITARFASYVFELDATQGEPRLDEEECITGLLDAQPSELHEFARLLRELPPDRRAWGEFRAPAHEIVAELLS